MLDLNLGNTKFSGKFIAMNLPENLSNIYAREIDFMMLKWIYIICVFHFTNTECDNSKTMETE